MVSIWPCSLLKCSPFTSSVLQISRTAWVTPKPNEPFLFVEKSPSFLFMHYIIIETYWQREICSLGMGDLIWYTYFLIKPDSQSSLKIKCRMVSMWLNLESVLCISSHILPCIEDSVKDKLESTHSLMCSRKFHNPQSGRKKFNLLNRRVIWLSVDDKALLCLHPV